MQGSNNYFRPQDPITRAEAASLLYRALIDRKDDDETKVVFPAPEEPKPTPINIGDAFSETDLKNWQTDKANGSWGVINKQVTAISTDKNLDHYLLPLKWNESDKVNHYELSVDVNISGTEGWGGLFFNGKDGKSNVVFVQKDRVVLGKVNNVNDDNIDWIATGSYKLKSSNRLKVVVDGSSVSIYMNGQFLFGQQQMKQEGTKLGLYLQREATKDTPREMTYLDNFSFQEVK
jgi:hypothetical protein